MSEINQDQHASESVGALDQIANLLIGEEGDPHQISQDDEYDEGQLDASTDNEVEEGQNDDDQGEVSWASVLGVNDDDVVLDDEGNFKGVKVGDEHVSLLDLKNGFQFNKANTQKAQALAEERRQFEEAKTQITEQYSNKIQTVNKLTEKLAEKFLEDYNVIDWAKLRMERPGEYAALQQDFNAKRNELQNIFAALEQESSTISKQAQQEQQAKWEQHLATQAQIAVNANPEWKDVEKFKSDMSNMTKFVGEAYGFSEQEFMSVYDARLLSLIKDAMSYRNGAKIVEKQVANKTPKFQKSNGLVKKQSKLDQLVKTAKNAKGYQKRAAETDAIAALLLQG